MGRGDKRTRKGKIFRASYGNTRPQRVKKANKAPAATKPATKKAPAATKTAKAKK